MAIRSQNIVGKRNPSGFWDGALKVKWKDMELLDAEWDVPRKTPPFIVYEINQDKIIHLKNGAKKEQYGDLLGKVSYKMSIINFFGHKHLCTITKISSKI